MKITQNVVFEFLNFVHFPPIFVLLNLTCLVTLFDRKLQVFKNSPKLTILGIINYFLGVKALKGHKIIRKNKGRLRDISCVTAVAAIGELNASPEKNKKVSYDFEWPYLIKIQKWNRGILNICENVRQKERSFGYVAKVNYFC